MLEHKEFLDNFCTSDKVEKLIEIGFTKSEGDEDNNSKTAAISVLNTLIQLFIERKSDNDGEARRPRGEFNFTSITKNQDASIDENSTALLSVLEKHSRTIMDSLVVNTQSQPLPTTFGVNIQPLGHLRLRIVELVQLLIKLDNPVIKEAVI